MKISKQEFYYILEILVHDDLINNFQCCKNENVIKVLGERNDAVYHFNAVDDLIDPQIYEVQHQIEELEKQLEELKKFRKNLLTTNQ